MARARSGPEITADILIQAYAAGLFPMAESAADEGLFWVNPERRGLFPLDGLIVSKSLAKTIRSDRFTVVADHDFEAVIEACAEPAPGRPSTWINRRIRSLFADLFARGQAHTIEAYRDGALVGGLYGLQIGGAFFGESMFHRATDASKVCLAHLGARLVAGGFTLLDAQFVTPHLETLGAIEVDRERYRAMLDHALRVPATFQPFGETGPVSGETVLALLELARNGTGTGPR